MLINGVEYTSEKLAGMIDYTILDPDATENAVRETCKTAIQYKFKGVYPNPYWVPLVADLIEGTGIETGIALSFPFGANPTEFKMHEAKENVKVLKGRPACIDMVTNIGRLKDKDYSFYTQDIAAVVKVAHDAGVQVKAILEVAMLSDDEVRAAAECAAKAGVDFVKTSTGRGGNPAIKHVRIMRQSVPPGIGVKFAGFGSYNPAQLTIMAIAAGATRIGARRGPQIIDEIQKYFADVSVSTADVAAFSHA
ncbi:MAG: deoxyribose-phosphate aldolase [Terracidiphilus sp.]